MKCHRYSGKKVSQECHNKKRDLIGMQFDDLIS